MLLTFTYLAFFRLAATSEQLSQLEGLRLPLGWTRPHIVQVLLPGLPYRPFPPHLYLVRAINFDSPECIFGMSH